MNAYQLRFENGIRYFPKKTGINILFHESNHNETPFQRACNNDGRMEAMQVIEETLIIRCNSSSSSADNNNNSIELNVADVLFTAAVNENIHLDFVYFLMRRHPNVLIKLLS